jgi:hypothetical protein
MPYSLHEDLCSVQGQQFTLGYLLTVVAANTTITYGEIADRLRADLSMEGKVFPTHIGWVVGTLMESILEVVHSAPLINLLVVNQKTGHPGEGADGFLRRRFRLPAGRPIRQERRKKLVAKAAGAVYAYAEWPNIYRRLFEAKPPASDPASLVTGTEIDGVPPSSVGGFGGPAESKEHRRLKEHIYTHPRVIGAPAQPNRKNTEQLLLSGDKVDVFFEHGDAAYLVEVKSIRSSEPDLMRGIFQCVKYRAVFEAQRKFTTPELSVNVTLVTEIEPPTQIRDLAKLHDVRCKVVAVNDRPSGGSVVV